MYSMLLLRIEIEVEEAGREFRKCAPHAGLVRLPAHGRLHCFPLCQPETWPQEFLISCSQRLKGLHPTKKFLWVLSLGLIDLE